MVGELGHGVVAEAGGIEAAEQLAHSAQFDFAILDINIAGRNIFPVAQILEGRRLPFLFASGYGTTGLRGSISCSFVSPSAAGEARSPSSNSVGRRGSRGRV